VAVNPTTSYLQILLGVLLSLAGLFSSTPLLQVLGGVGLLVSAWLFWQRWSQRRSNDQAVALHTPELTLVERWMPTLFFAVVVLVVVALLLFTLRQLGLI
jgi:nicotinamide riboside transporter PnuC